MNPSKTSRIIFAFVALALYAMSPAKAESGRGALCLTFDDRNFDAWERCIPLFGKYGAHATFFVCGEIDERAERCMKRLAAGGHSLGLHGLRHRKATEGVAALGEEGYLREEIQPQLAVCRAKGINVHSFAYPIVTLVSVTSHSLWCLSPVTLCQVPDTIHHAPWCQAMLQML